MMCIRAFSQFGKLVDEGGCILLVKRHMHIVGAVNLRISGKHVRR